MPTVLQDGPYSFIFFSSDAGEPPHIHVKRDRKMAKYWLDTVRLAKNRRFPAAELRKIGRLVRDHREELLEAWHDYFGA
jgi:Domain of unknown function (DUF4160)